MDEIAELPESLQTHLLRVLVAGGEYPSLGDPKTHRSDFRLIGATNQATRRLREGVAARFEQRIQLAPLRERPEDVPLLLAHLFRERVAASPDLFARICDEAGAAMVAFSGVRAFCSAPPADNTRGLARALADAAQRWRGSSLELELEAASDPPAPEAAVAPKAARGSWEAPTPEEIQACLDKHAGVQGPVWRELGFANRYQLQRLVKKYGLRTAGLGPHGSGQAKAHNKGET